MSGISKNVFFCSCGHSEHQIIVETDDEEFIYVQMCLSDTPPLWRRVILGVKYVLGHRGSSGMFSEVCLDRFEAMRLKNLLEYSIHRGVSDVPN